MKAIRRKRRRRTQAEIRCLPAREGEAEEEDPDPEMSKRDYIRHLLTHLPKDPNGDICNEGKMRQRPARRRIPVLPRDPVEWGDTLLADHLTVGIKHADLALGVGKERSVLLLKDLGTAVKDLFPTTKKTKASCFMAIREFGGTTRWTTFASDNAPGLISVARDEYMTHATSTPGRPESNGFIERGIGITSDGARAMLAQSGLWHPWWTYAARAFCHHANVSGSGSMEVTSGASSTPLGVMSLAECLTMCFSPRKNVADRSGTCMPEHLIFTIRPVRLLRVWISEGLAQADS